MTTIRAAAGAALLLLGACMWEREPMEEAVLKYDNLSERDLNERIRSRLSEKGTVQFLPEGGVRVVDFRENVARIARSLESADQSPFTAVLHFQLIQGTQDGPVDEPLVPIAAALRDVVRFRGFELIGSATLSATEGNGEDENLEMVDGHEQYVVGVEVTDIRASNTRDGSVELSVRLRRDGRSTMLTTNVVIPIGKSVVLGRTHPDDTDEAVLLVVRPELDVAEPSRRSGREVRVRVGSHPPEATHDVVHPEQHRDIAVHQLALHKAQEAVERATQSLRAGCPGGQGCRREEEQLRAARRALIDLTLDPLRSQFQAGVLTREQYEERRLELMRSEMPVPTAVPATTPPDPARRPPPA